MKIAYILTQFPSFTETFVSREISEVMRRGHEVKVFSLKKFDDWDRIHEDMRQFQGQVHYSDLISLEVIRSNWSWLVTRPVKYLSLFIYLLRRFVNNPAEVSKAVICYPLIAHYARLQALEKVTHIHSHFARMGATAALLCAELLDVPFSFTVHAFDIFLGRDDPFLKEKLLQCKAVICISQYNINYLTEICPEAAPEKFKIVRCGVLKSNVAEKAKEQAHAPLKVLSVGSLIEKKGHHYLIKAIADLVSEGMTDVVCDIIGEGRDRNILERLIIENGLTGHVRLLGSQTQDVVNASLNDCDIFVLACINSKNGDRDGIPVALMEAMSMAKPVISTYVSGIPELIQNRQNGLLAPERNVPALCDAIRDLAMNIELRTVYGNRAAKTISDEFTVEKNTSKLILMFES